MIRSTFNTFMRSSFKKCYKFSKLNFVDLASKEKINFIFQKNPIKSQNLYFMTKFVFSTSQQPEITKLESEAEQTKSTKGENSMEYLESLHKLSFAYAKINNLQKSIEIYEKVVKKFEENIEDKLSPALGDTFKNLLMLYKRAGKLIEFIPLTLRLIEIRKKETGPESQVVANEYNELGVAYYHIQNFDEALSNYNHALNIREKHFGSDSLEVIEIKNNIATVYYSLGQFDKSKQLFQENIEKLKLLPNFNEKMIITPMTNLAASLEHEGRHDEALSKYDEVITILKKVEKKESYFMANIYHSMGIVCLKSGNVKNAEEYHSASLKINQSIYNDNHPSVAENLHNLGICYEATGQFDKSLEVYNKSILIKQKTLGENHPSVAETYNNIGIVQKLSGNLEKSRQSFEKAIEILKLHHLDDTSVPIFGDLYFNIGSIYLDEQNLEKCMEYFDKAENVFRNFFDELHPKLADLYFGKARIEFIFTRNFTKAREYLDKSIKSNEKYAPNNPNAYVKYSMKGSCFFEERNFKDAKEWYKKSLNLLKNNLNPLDEQFKINSALLDYQIGACDLELEDYLEAHERLSNAINVFEKNFPEAYETLVELYFMQANIERKLNNKEKAKEFLSKSQNIMEKLLEKMPGHPVLIKKLEEIKKSISSN